MKIFIEGYKYSPEVLKCVLPENIMSRVIDDDRVSCIGYFRGTVCDDFVFFLPKVVLENKKMLDGSREDRVLCTRENPLGWSVEDVIDFSATLANEKGEKGKREKEFLYEFAVWIYRAIVRFNETHRDSKIILRHFENQAAGFKRRYITNTLLDVILALIRFNRENEDYFTFRVKERHSGLNKINWTRTIAKTTAFIQDGVPLYLEPKIKKKVINFDEELLIIFYSILEHINRQFNFTIPIKLGYELLTPSQFKRYLDGYGEARLRQIKYKYFSDRDLELWELCFAFFNKAHKAHVVSQNEEYLLAKDFNIVFETMIDELIGDSELQDFKEFSDGKVIDHFYVDESLARRNDSKSFYIADSKYYKVGESLDPNSQSVAKQFTYAKNMLQLNLDLFLPGESTKDVVPSVENKRKPFKYRGIGLQRDNVTEGYDIIPNFFISARIDEELDYEKSGLEWRGHNNNGEFRNIHFKNRLFDRDSLILLHYNINFLYVLSLYVKNNQHIKERWKREVREEFRRKIRDILGGKDENGGRFRFMALIPQDGVEAAAFFKENFKYVVGKVVDSSVTINNRPVYILALENHGNVYHDKSISEARYNEIVSETQKENEAVCSLLETVFDIFPFTLGEDLNEKLSRVVHTSTASGKGCGLTSSKEGAFERGVQVLQKIGGPLFGYIKKSGICPCPKNQCGNPKEVKMLVLPFTQGAHLFRVKDGCIPKTKSSSELTNGKDALFKNITFPYETCYVWEVEMIS